MTLDDLQILADRMTYGPVPTQVKKVYAYLGHVHELLQVHARDDCHQRQCA